MKRKKKVASVAPNRPKSPQPSKRGYASKVSAGWVETFLKALAETDNITLSARAAGIDRRTVQRWRKEDADFAQACTEAMEEATDLVKAEIRRRAVDGLDEPVIYEGGPTFIAVDRQGKVIPMPGGKKQIELAKSAGVRIVPFTIKRYSDGLLQFLAKSARPGEFGDKTHLTSDGSFKGEPQIVLEHTAPPAPKE